MRFLKATLRIAIVILFHVLLFEFISLLPMRQPVSRLASLVETYAGDQPLLYQVETARFILSLDDWKQLPAPCMPSAHAEKAALYALEFSRYVK